MNIFYRIIILFTLFSALASCESKFTFETGHFAPVTPRDFNQELTRIASFNFGEIGKITTKGNYAYVAFYGGEKSVRYYSKNTNSFIGACESCVTTSAYTVKVIGDRLFVLGVKRVNYPLITGSIPSLDILDISNPASPMHITSYSDDSLMDSLFSNIEVKGNTLFAGTDKGDILILDSSNLSSIIKLSSFKPGSSIEGLHIKYQNLYIAAGESGLFAYDISNPYSPVQLDHLTTIGYCDELSIQDNLLFLAEWNQGARIIDISSPTNLTSISSITTTGNVWQAIEKDDHLYLAKNNGEVSIYNITNPTSPTLTSTITNSSILKDSRSISLEGNTLYIADSGMGIRVVDISNPAMPGQIQVQTSPIRTRVENALKKDNYFILAAVDRGIKIVDTSLREIGSFNGFPTSVFGLNIEGDTLYAGYGGAGLVILNISNPASPILIGQYDTPGWAYGVATSGNYAYVGDYDSLQVINITNKAAPTLQTTIPLSTNCFKIQKLSDLLLLACSTSLHLFDISNASTPTLINSIPAEISIKNFDLDKDTRTIFLIDSNNKIKVYNISNPVAPQFIVSHNFSAMGYAIKYHNNKLYVGLTRHYSAVFDVEDLMNFKEIKAFPQIVPNNFDVAGNILMSSSQFRGFYTFSIE